MGIIIGLTGGIGSGKSTVASLLVERGAIVIDADQVAHEAYEPGTAGYDAVLERFGPAVLGEDGKVDRARLGAIVFRDHKALEDLNAIVHPSVRREVARRVVEAMGNDPQAVVVIEAALMTETGWRGGAGALWVVISDPELVAERLIRSRELAMAELRLRLAAQASNEERRRVATRVIENNGTLEDLEAEVHAAWCELLDTLSS